MITLCELAAPVSIRPPQSPHLKPFSFFVSRTAAPDGRERLLLNMGYFATLAEAQLWEQRVKGRYPEATATLAPTPTALQEPGGTDEAAQQPLERFVPVAKEPLTDTGVMKLLETRAFEPPQSAAADGSSAQIPMVRPEDTGTRRVLKDAVAQGAPVSFAVQLDWSPQPIDLTRVPSLGIYKGHTLYVAEIRREERSRYFLRLGFFADPVSAKQLAFQARSKYSSCTVVPVTEKELLSAREPRFESTATAVQQAADPARKAKPALKAKPGNRGSRATPRSGETLDETLQLLAQREILNDPDSISDSGVRHLKVEIQERNSDRD